MAHRPKPSPNQATSAVKFDTRKIRTHSFQVQIGVVYREIYPTDWIHYSFSDRMYYYKCHLQFRKNPCKICIVQACCRWPCEDKWMYARTRAMLWINPFIKIKDFIIQIIKGAWLLPP